MGIFSRRRTESRAEAGMVQFEDGLLQALLGSENITRETAIQVPTIAGGVDLIANIVASTPIKLYRDNDGKAEEVTDDLRVKLLNDETGDTLSASEFWKAITRDYYLGKGGYAYIHKEKGRFRSLHYVDERHIAIQRNTDPIFKDFKICVQGKAYEPFDFLRILRNTRDGAEGISIIEENKRLIEIAYQTMCFELYLAKKGGNKKGFLKSKRKLDKPAMDELKEAFSQLYSNNYGSDKAIVLNDGVEFQESSNTSAEMQLNENKLSNAKEFAKIFHISEDVMAGRSKDTAALAKLAAIPFMMTIQSALNRDFLFEREKGTSYWAFDTKELLKGDIGERYGAYEKALNAGFLQIDEVRYMEDLEPLGFNYMKLGLDAVLYDPRKGLIYTPNTNQISEISAEKAGNMEGGE